MKEISTSASYVQNRELLDAEAAKQAALSSLCEQDPATRQVWERLATPQTVETLSRSLDDDVGDIKASLTKLIRAELIQISPDS